MIQTPEKPADLIVCENLVKIYKIGTMEILALQGLDFRASEGEMVGNPSARAAATSMHLNILGANDVPTAGTARVADYDLLALPAKRAAVPPESGRFRLAKTGRNLPPYLSALQNVSSPCTMRALSAKRPRNGPPTCWRWWAAGPPHTPQAQQPIRR